MQNKNLLRGVGLALLCLCSGCALIAKWSYGIRNPKPVSTDFIIKQAKKKGWDTERLLFLSEKAWAPFFEQGTSFPQVFVYDHAGQLLFKRPAGAACAKGFPGFLRALKQKDKAWNPPAKGQPVLFNGLPELKSQDGQTFRWSPTHNYVIFSFWAHFAGKMSKWVDSVEQISRHSTPLSALHFMVNCDPIDNHKRRP